MALEVLPHYSHPIMNFWNLVCMQETMWQRSFGDDSWMCQRFCQLFLNRGFSRHFLCLLFFLSIQFVCQLFFLSLQLMSQLFLSFCVNLRLSP